MFTVNSIISHSSYILVLKNAYIYFEFQEIMNSKVPSGQIILKTNDNLLSKMCAV